MDLWHKILTGVAIALVVLALVIGFYWLQAHDAALRAEAKVAADQAALEKLAAQQTALSTQLDQVRADQAKQLATVGQNFAAAQTPSQLAALLTQLLKQPVTVNIPPATAANPNPAPVIQLPDTPQAKAYFQDCETCKVNYAAAQKDLTIAKSQKSLDDQKIEVITNERDTYKKIASGGSFLHRATNRMKDFLVDGAIITAIVCGSGHCK